MSGVALLPVLLGFVVILVVVLLVRSVITMHVAPLIVLVSVAGL
jgi:hypothetical protein